MVTDGLTPLTFLLFAGLVFGSVVVLGGALVALLLKQPLWVRRLLWLEGAGLAAYTLLYLLASLISHNRTLDLGQEKHICEVDCHVAYSVVGVKTQGARYTVTVKVCFDQTTISARRGMGPLTPNSRYVAVVDGRGRRYEAPTDGLRRPLVPGESYTTDLVFDVPANAGQVRLILRNADPESAFMIGHENSFWHGRITFQLPG